MDDTVRHVRAAGGRPRRALDAAAMTGSLLCVAFGVTMAAAWLTRSTALLSIGVPRPVQFETALAVGLTGAALAPPVVGRWPRMVLAPAALDTALALLAMAAGVLDRNLGLGALLAQSRLAPPGGSPGRVASSSAVCLIVAGLGLPAWGPWRRRPRPAALAASGSLISAIAVLTIFGYASSAFHRYDWGRLSSMPLGTAAALLVLGISMQCVAWLGTSGAGLPGWLPVSAGITALGLAAGMSLAVIGRSSHSGRVSTGVAANAAMAIGLLLAALVTLSAWLAQQAEARKRQARAGEQRTFKFLEAMPVAVLVAVPDGRPYYANREAARVLGQTAEPGTGAGRPAAAHRAFVAGTARPYPAEDLPLTRAARGEPWHVDDMEIRHPDGSVTILESWGTPITGPDGRVEHVIVVGADSSERKAGEQTIRAQAALLDLAPDAILTLDLDGRITSWNTGAEHTYGFAGSAVVGRLSRELLGTSSSEPLAAIMATVAATGHWEGELAQRRADGRAIIVESRWAAQRDPAGRLTGFLKVDRDITARKAAERELRVKSEQLAALNATLERQVAQRTARLERANRDLETFAYSIAHDLRTPLRGLSGFAEALVEDYGDRLDETGREYAGRIQAASHRMAELIDDLLELARVSRAEVSLEPVDLSAEAAAIAEEVRAGYPGRLVRVTVQAGMLATADRGLIRVVLRNLFDNAWKFTARSEDARVEFGTSRTADAAACYVVRDNGAGFDPAYAGKLFQPFQRLHRAAEFPGTGIGLASVRQIIERHGGRTWAEGAVGGGAAFYFTLGAGTVPRQRDPGGAVPRALP